MAREIESPRKRGKPFTKGNPGGPGRKAGIPNKVTQEFRETVRQLLEDNSENVKRWLTLVAEGDGTDHGKPDPAKALDLIAKLAEFAAPKLGRVEHVGDGGGPVQIIAAGRPVQIVAREDEDDRTVRANRYYWGVVLKEISEQACIEGQRWAADAWHELFKRQFLGFEIKKTRVAGKRRPVVVRRLKSTTGLSIKKFTKYLEKVQAFAVTDLGVRFSTDWTE